MKLLLKGVIVSALLLGGCGVPAKNRGEYNIGLCEKGAFMALHVKVNDNKLEVTDFNPGPHTVRHADSPISFKLTSVKGEVFTFEGSISERISVTFRLSIVDGKVKGTATYSDGTVDDVFGIKDSLDNLLVDGNRDYKACQLLKGEVNEGILDNSTH